MKLCYVCDKIQNDLSHTTDYPIGSQQKGRDFAYFWLFNVGRVFSKLKAQVEFNLQAVPPCGGCYQQPFKENLTLYILTVGIKFFFRQ